MKSISYAFIGFLLFGFFGLILGSGETRYMNKTERGVADDFGMVWILGGIGAVIGLMIGVNVGQDEKREKELGIDKMETTIDKDGRYWFMVSEWTNPISGQTNKIKTLKHDGEVCTFFNEIIFERHGHNSGARNTIEKSHQNGKIEIIKELKKGNLEHYK